MAWNINGGVNAQMEDPNLQDILLEVDVVILLEAKIKERQTFLPPKRLKRTLMATHSTTSKC